MSTTTRTLKTKLNARAEARDTIVTFDWEGVTEPQLREMAEAWAAIKIQIGYRKNGIPDTDTVKVASIVPGTRAPRGPVNVLAVAQTMTAEERAALIAKLSAM